MHDSAYSFLDVKGEMAELTRNFEWGHTPIGAASGWPQMLKTTISTMLRSKFPMFICWGPELICFYNDGYRQSLGDGGKHPAILGTPFKDAWSEIWEIIHPRLDEVIMSGNAIWKEDLPVPIYRNGGIDNTYWTFSYSPLIDESGNTGGVLVTCIETTEKIKAFKDLEESHQQLGFAIEAAELGTFDYNPRTNKFIANARLKHWFGLPDSAELALPLALASIVDQEREKVAAAIQACFDPATDGKYEIEYSLKAIGQAAEKRVLAKGRVLFNSKKEAVRLSGTLQDITALKQAAIKKQEDKIREQHIINREKVKAQDSERNQLATELHDNVCQILAAVKIQLSLFANKQTQHFPVIHECIKFVDEALLETRDISHRMVMPRFAEISLGVALTNLCEIYNNEDRVIAITQTGNLQPGMPVSHKEALYRIAQEQFNNIHKYSGAVAVKVNICQTDEFVRLTIEDNGVGFDPVQLKPGIGLDNIRNRAELLKGFAQIVSAPGEGCSLLVQIPLGKLKHATPRDA